MFWNDRIQVAADYNIPRDYYNDLRVGTEVRAHSNVSLRLGYRREFSDSDDPATGLSYGLGLHFHQLELDYALTPSNQFDDVHRISFGYSFGSGPEEKPEKPKREKVPPPPAPSTPPVIASAAPAPAAPKPQGQVQTARPPAPAKAAPAPAPVQTEKVAKAPNPPNPEYDVVLPGYWSKESALAELKALEMLGFRTKDAIVERSGPSSYQVRLARVRSKSNAEDMAASLVRMSFRAVVKVAER
jgi:cell division septation protein DedD